MTEGTVTKVNNSETTTVNGTVTAANGETTVAFTNYLTTIVPTGFDDYATIGIWFAVIGILSAATIIVIKQRKGMMEK